jgi:hypothetical protein
MFELLDIPMLECPISDDLAFRATPSGRFPALFYPCSSVVDFQLNCVVPAWAFGFPAANRPSFPKINIAPGGLSLTLRLRLKKFGESYRVH